MANILVIDIGGTNVKILATGQKDVHKIPSGAAMTATDMVAKVKDAAKDWGYEAISIGYPGPVVQGKLVLEPKNLAAGWVGLPRGRARATIGIPQWSRLHDFV